VSRAGIAGWLRAWWSGNHRRITFPGVLFTVSLGAGLAVAALGGVAWVAGFHRVWHALTQVDWQWLPAVAGLVLMSHVGYVVAYRGVVHDVAGRPIPTPQIGATVAAGFGPLSPRSGFALDAGLWRDAGLGRKQTSDLVVRLGLMEYAVLAPATFAAALALFLEGYRAQTGLLPSWVLGVPIGSAVTMGLIGVRRHLPDWPGVARLTRGLEAVVSLWQLLRTRTGLEAATGMTLYWAADIAAFGICMAMVHHRGISVAVLIVGYATGYALTRRSLPLAGSGAVEALLPFAMSWVSRPLATALVAVFAYRLVNLWLPLAPAVLALRRLRDAPAARQVRDELPGPAIASG
jgi:uncharacterized membrane protein YbhN (UPF0104 family)